MGKERTGSEIPVVELGEIRKKFAIGKAQRGEPRVNCMRSRKCTPNYQGKVYPGGGTPIYSLYNKNKIKIKIYGDVPPNRVWVFNQGS